MVKLFAFLLFLQWMMLVTSQCQYFPYNLNVPTSAFIEVSNSNPSTISVSYKYASSYSISVYSSSKRINDLQYSTQPINATSYTLLLKDKNPNNSSLRLLPNMSLLFSLLFIGQFLLYMNGKKMWMMVTVMMVLVMIAEGDDCQNSFIVEIYNPHFQTTNVTAPVCNSGNTTGPVQKPVFVKNFPYTGTSWYSAPVIMDLDGDGKRELIAAFYQIYVYNSSLVQISSAPNNGRVYAPHVVADLDGDGVIEIAAAQSDSVYVYEFNKANKSLVLKSGWPALTVKGSELRGMAAADVDGDGAIEIFVTSTNSITQVFAFSSNGKAYQPVKGHNPAWPRYNKLNGTGNDGDANCYGNDGYGEYGLNIGIGNIDDDSNLEIISTYDNHQIQAFKYDGVAVNASSYYLRRGNPCDGTVMNWGQFIRWANMTVEDNHYHNHTGSWPSVTLTEWLQFTASPPNVVDLDLDGKNEVVSIPNLEMDSPYDTKSFGIFVLEGNHGDGSRSARRKPGWEVIPTGKYPIKTSSAPLGVPSPVTVSIIGDAKPEIIYSGNDGYIYCYDASAKLLWSYDYRHGKSVMFASEVTVADLNQDGVPEILFSTYGDATVLDSGYFVILDNNGRLLWDTALPTPSGYKGNGNGNGAPSGVAIGDLDGDGAVELFIQTFDHGMDVYTIPQSAENCLLWSTSRGGRLRTGQAGK